MRNHDPIDPERRMMLDLDDGHVHMHITAALLFDAAPLRTDEGGVDIEAIRRLVAARLHLVPHAQQRVLRTPIGGRPVWVDDRNFNLQYHVRHTHLPVPGDERQLKRLCGQIASQELDREKPLWELWVVEGVEGDRVAIIAKAHQGMTGELWGFDLVDRLLSETPAESPLEVPAWYPRPLPTDAELASADLRRSLAAPLALLRRTVDRARRGDALGDSLTAALGGPFEPGGASETVLNQPIGPHRRVDWMTTDDDVAARIAEASATSADAIITSTIAGAVSRFLERRGTPLREQEELTIRVCEPANAGGLRVPAESASALAWTVAELPIADVDPVQRLHDTAAALEKGAPVSYDLLAEASEFLPGLASVVARRQLAQRASNITVTRLEGPRDPLYLLGAKLQEIFPVMPLVPRQSLRVAVLGYCGRLHWSFNSDWDQMPDLHDLVQAAANALEDLHKAVEAACARADDREPATGAAASRAG